MLLALNRTDLPVDEAQYWVWARLELEAADDRLGDRRDGPLRGCALLGARAGGAAWLWGKGALVAASPNLVWNVLNGMTTFSHTMETVNRVKADPAPARGLNLGSLALFFAAQFAVVGPVVFGALLTLPFLHGGPARRTLLWMPLLTVALICGQALIFHAYGKACFAESLAVQPWPVGGRWLWWPSLAVNGFLCLALPVLTVFPVAFAEAGRPGAVAVVAERRDLLADLV